MDMKINLNQLIEERNSRAWTQGHLAQVCGLSLRTIQRIEKTAVASQESIKALASVFELSIEDLIYQENSVHKHTSTKQKPHKTAKIFAKLGMLLMLVIPLIWLITVVSGTNLMLVVSDIEGAKQTISSSSTLALLFGHTKISYLTLLPAIIFFTISIVLDNNSHSWVKKYLIISTIVFLASSPAAGIFVVLLVMFLLLYTSKNNQYKI